MCIRAISSKTLETLRYQILVIIYGGLIFDVFSRHALKGLSDCKHMVVLIRILLLLLGCVTSCVLKGLSKVGWYILLMVFKNCVAFLVHGHNIAARNDLSGVCSQIS